MQDTIYHREITEFFKFFSDWFDGAIPNTDEQYSRISRVIPADSTFISHKGEMITARSFFMNSIRTAHSTIPQLHMQAKNIQLQWENGDLALIIFEEWSIAPIPVTGGRLCSAIFRKNPNTPNGIEWLHFHETLLPLTLSQQEAVTTESLSPAEFEA